MVQQRFRTLRCFSGDPSLLCSIIPLSSPSLLNFNLLEVVSREQQILLPKHNISEHMNSSLKKQFLSCQVYDVSHNKFDDKSF